ncbi:MAG: hypothetical protein IPN58_04805 [Anaerolineales bacterium]|nr:hypothetical protein [Anaerolineales bacterium]
MANVSIGGNVTDSVMVFGNDNYVVKIGDVNGGIVNIIKPSDKPKYSARTAPVTIKPRDFPSLIDREYEFEAIKKATQFSSPVSIWGQDGIGKTSFIRHLTHTLDTSNFTSGTIYLNASGLGYEDLLQALFDSFFDSGASYKPSTTEILRELQSIKALIFLDDLQIGRDEAASILNAAPNSLFIFSSIERSLWGEGEIVPLRGLPESEAFKLFEKELSRALNEQEKAAAAAICSVLQGNPLQILQAASLARDSGKPIEHLLNEVKNEREENRSMVYMGMANLSDSEKQILALLAAAGGNIVPLQHVTGILKSGKEQENLQKLIKLGLVQSHSPRYSINDALVSSITSAWEITSWQDVLLNYAINWLGQQPASALVEESSGLLIHTIKNAGERKKWREVIQLGRALEKFMILYKRWQTWSDILNLILTAAKALNDSQVQAWALHQLGSRALYLGYTSEAKTLLSQALNIRQVIGDKAGQALTQHNINTLNGIIAPLKGDASGCKKYVSWGCGTAVVMTAALTLAWLVFTFIIPQNITPTKIPTPSRTPSPTITPTSTPSPTNTPVPVLLYDFIDHADEAYWFNYTKNSDGEFENDLTFFFEPVSPDPETYMAKSENNYVGWEPNVTLMNGNIQKRVLLTYPYFDYFKVFGNYEKVSIDQSAPNGYLELQAGYKDIFIESTEGAVFRIYINDRLMLEEFYKFGDKPINTIKQVSIQKGVYQFRLEVESLDPSPYDYAVWAVVKLWDRNPR